MSYLKISHINNDTNCYEYTTEKARIEIDYNGNIYICYNDIYYIVSLDSDNENGAELIKINNNNYYYDIFAENKYIFQNMRFGNILSGESTLSGKIYERLNNMTINEKEKYVLKNNYNCSDPQFIEKSYYRVNYEELDEEEDENIPFHISGIDIKNEKNGLLLSRLLSPYPCSFDTIYIDGDIISKNVLSSSERLDGYCSSRLTLYSFGYIRCNFIDRVILSRLCIINSELIVKVDNTKH
jgi:hypothetical protein